MYRAKTENCLMANDERPNLTARLGRSASPLGSSKNFHIC